MHPLFFFLMMLSYVVYQALVSNYQPPLEYVINLEKACGQLSPRQFLYNKSFIETGIVAIAYGIMLAVFKTEGSYNKSQFRFNYDQLTLFQKFKRLLINIMLPLLIFLPFMLIPFGEYVVLMFLFKIMLPSFVFGFLQFNEMQILYRYFKVQVDGDYLLFNKEERYGQI